MSRVRFDIDQLKAAQPDISAWVSANAGAGKTQVLVNRIARLLLAGADPASILCLTYTKAAAAEMAERIHKTLGSWTGLTDRKLLDILTGIGIQSADSNDLKRARQLFALALDTPGGFKIQTIHGFCERILQLFPIEAGLAPGFDVLDDKQRKALLEEVREAIIAEAHEQPESPLGQALSTVSQYASTSSIETLTDEIIAVARHAENLGEQIEPVLRRFFEIGNNIDRDALRLAILSFDEAALASIIPKLMGTPKTDKGNASNNEKLAVGLQGLLSDNDETTRLDQLRQLLFVTKDGSSRVRPKISAGIGSKADKELAEAIFNREYDRILPLMQAHDEVLRIEATTALAVIGSEMARRFAKAKRDRAAYDFDDLIEKVRALLTDRAAAAWVLYKLDRGIEHVLVDEAQDTSPAQWQIMQAITAEFFAGEGIERKAARTVFVVGDQKQSIFSFQGADVRIFTASQKQFELQARGAGEELRNVPLTVSYRTQGTLLKIIDKVFAEGQPARRMLGIDGTEGLLHQNNRPDESGIFELWPLVGSEEDEGFDRWRVPTRVREQISPQSLLARQIAETIASWIGKRWLASRNRTVQPGDILLLFRRRGRMFRLMIAALREAGVAVSGSDRLKPAENIAVQDMLALIRVMTLPADDYALACVLKSPLVSVPLNEEELFALCHGRETTSLWDRLQASGQAAAAELQGYRDKASSLRAYELIEYVLIKRRPHILARLGGEADDALAALSDQALAYEKERAASLSGFAEWFRAEDNEIKRDMDAGQGEVRLMTVHGAKGLEADIVFLPDAADIDKNERERLLLVDAAGGSGDTPLWKIKGLMPSPAMERLKTELKGEAQSEFTRLLYVALTRARDELYVCGAQDKCKAQETSWYCMVEQALKDSKMLREVESGGRLLWRCGADPSQREDKAGFVQPPVVVPDCLLRPVADEAEEPVALTPSLLANPEGATHALEQARQGRIAHRILERIAEVPAEHRHSYIERQAAKHRLSPRLGSQLAAVLALPEAAILFGPESSAETGFGLRLPDGQPLTGTMDRLVLRRDEIWLVDYKSDAMPPSRLEPRHPHFTQLASYCYGLQKAYPERSIRAAVIWLVEARLEWLDPAALAGAIAGMEDLAGAAKA